MKIEKRLNILFDLVIENEELTTKLLNSVGFNSKDINVLIEEGKIIRIKRGYYSFIDWERLFSYGKYLIKLKEFDKANKCFNKCYEINPNHNSSVFQLFIRAIQDKNYEEAFKFLDKLFETDNKYYINDTNLYLYLLSYITEVPDKYKEHARFISFDEIKVDSEDKRYNETYEYNRVRTSILNNKFSYALKQLKDITQKKGSDNVQDYLIKTLLFQIVNLEKENKNILSNLIKEKKYEDIVLILENKELKHKLNIMDTYILKLAKILINIKYNNISYQIKVLETSNIYEAIDGYNFKLALDLCTNFSKENNLTENLMELILNDICNIINEKKKEDKVIEYDSLKVFGELVISLMKSDIENAFILLKKYLNLIGKEEYELIVVNLIKVSLLNKDIAYTKPMIILNSLNRDSYEINISDFIQEFYIALSSNKIDDARIYLEIIENCYKLGKYDFDIKLLKDMINSVDSTEDINKKDKLDENREIKCVEKTKIKASIKFDRKKGVEKENIEIRDSEVEYLDANHNKLVENGGIILLKPMNKERRKRVYNLAKNYNDMICFSIGEGEVKQIVLKYRCDEKIDIKTLIAEAKKSFANKQYILALEHNLKLLHFGKPKAIVYAGIGLCYMKLRKKDLAIDYLTVATNLAKKEGTNYDFSDLLLFLKGYISEVDAKKKVKFKEEEFYKKNDNYGIENIDEIFEYIYKSGLSVKDACLELGLSLEQVDIIRLIYARMCFAKGYYDKGNIFIKSVEKSKNKTDLTRKIFNEIIKNKKFFINRKDEFNIKLCLSLNP